MAAKEPLVVTEAVYPTENILAARGFSMVPAKLIAFGHLFSAYDHAIVEYEDGTRATLPRTETAYPTPRRRDPFRQLEIADSREPPPTRPPTQNARFFAH